MDHRTGPVCAPLQLLCCLGPFKNDKAYSHQHRKRTWKGHVGGKVIPVVNLDTGDSHRVHAQVSTQGGWRGAGEIWPLWRKQLPSELLMQN